MINKTRTHYIAKFGNNIFAKNREDKSKTDLQSVEVIAYANYLKTVLQENVVILSESDVAAANKLVDADLFESFDNVVFNSADTFTVFCGVYINNNVNAYIKQLLESNAAYDNILIVNDIRLCPDYDFMRDNFTTVLSQVKHIEDYDGIDIRQIHIDMLPLLMHQNSMSTIQTNVSNKEFDISISFMHFEDMDEYRRNAIISLINNNDELKFLIIGPHSTALSNMIAEDIDVTYTGVVKCTDMLSHLTKAKLHFIINEESYNKASLLPNRFYESLMAVSLPLFNEDTFTSICKDKDAAYKVTSVCSAIFKDDCKIDMHVHTNAQITHNYFGFSEFRRSMLAKFAESLKQVYGWAQ